MYKSFFKSILLSLFIVLFVGCGEVILSDPNKPITNDTSSPQAEEVIINTQPSTFTRIQNTDCINTTLGDSSQTYNEITSTNLRN